MSLPRPLHVRPSHVTLSCDRTRPGPTGSGSSGRTRTVTLCASRPSNGSSRAGADTCLGVSCAATPCCRSPAPRADGALDELFRVDPDTCFLGAGPTTERFA